jgi:hypothetical protein
MKKDQIYNARKNDSWICEDDIRMHMVQSLGKKSKENLRQGEKYMPTSMESLEDKNDEYILKHSYLQNGNNE